MHCNSSAIDVAKQIIHSLTCNRWQARMYYLQCLHVGQRAIEHLYYYSSNRHAKQPTELSAKHMSA